MAVPPQLLFGPMLLGVFFNSILWGIMIVQMYIYFEAYRKIDKTSIKVFVLYLLVLESANTALDIYMMYEPLVLKWGSREALTFFPLTLAADPMTTVLISTPIQLFIAHRIHLLSAGSYLLPITIATLAFVAFGGGIWTGISAAILRVFARKPELHWPALTWLLSSAVGDVLITGGLTWNLYKHKTGFSSTDTTINRIIRFTIQTGLITAVFAILDVVFFMALPHTTLNFIWDFSLSKLYTNVLLSTLNTRANWKIDGGARGAAGTRPQQNVLFGSVSGFSLRPMTDCTMMTDTDFIISKERRETATTTTTDLDIELNAYQPPNPPRPIVKSEWIDGSDSER